MSRETVPCSNLANVRTQRAISFYLKPNVSLADKVNNSCASISCYFLLFFFFAIMTDENRAASVRMEIDNECIPCLFHLAVANTKALAHFLLPTGKKKTQWQQNPPGQCVAFSACIHIYSCTMPMMTAWSASDFTNNWWPAHPTSINMVLGNIL